MRAFPLVLVLLAALGVLGCTKILDIPEEVTAYRWCLDADPPRGFNGANLNFHEITTPSGVWTRGCKCYCPADHQIMILGANGQLAPGSQQEAFYLNEVALLQAKAALTCNERVLEIQDELGTVLSFATPGAITCAASVTDEAPYYTTECVLDEEICPPGAPGGGGGGGGGFPGSGGEPEGSSGATGMTGMVDTGMADTGMVDTGGGIPGTGGATAAESSDDGGAMVYGLDDWSTVIECPVPTRCNVDAAFVDELLQDLSVLSDDYIGVHPGTSALGHHGFVFAVLGADSLPAALGLEPGDVVWSINGIGLRSLADVGGAFEELHQTTEFSVLVDRKDETREHSVELVSFDDR